MVERARLLELYCPACSALSHVTVFRLFVLVRSASFSMFQLCCAMRCGIESRIALCHDAFDLSSRRCVVSCRAMSRLAVLHFLALGCKVACCAKGWPIYVVLFGGIAWTYLELRGAVLSFATTRLAMLRRGVLVVSCVACCCIDPHRYVLWHAVKRYS